MNGCEFDGNLSLSISISIYAFLVAFYSTDPATPTHTRFTLDAPSRLELGKHVYALLIKHLLCTTLNKPIQLSQKFPFSTQLKVVEQVDNISSTYTQIY